MTKNTVTDGAILALVTLRKEKPSNSTLKQAAEDLNSWASEGISSLELNNEQYPEALRHIHNPPPILFYRGMLPDKFNAPTTVAIVGSRRADVRGKEIAKLFAKELTARGACIVSGLAYGIDCAAHEGALEAKTSFPTIAVLGSGFHNIYPASHVPLCAEILAQGGLIFSQFEPDEKPFPQNFLNRNRIISGISSAVIIVQASDKSGSLVTARYALEQGREVLVVPGSISDFRYRGSHNLIREGASLITSVEDIEEALPALKTLKVSQSSLSQNVEKIPLSESQRELIKELAENDSIHYDTFLTSHPNPTQLARDLLELELNGLVMRLPGNYLALAMGTKQ